MTNRGLATVSAVLVVGIWPAGRNPRSVRKRIDRKLLL